MAKKKHPPALGPAALRLLHAMFPPGRREQAEALLREECGSKQLGGGGGLSRIHVAVLRLSRGTLGGLRSAIALACEDWRDVLVSAGFGNDTRAHNHWAPAPADIDRPVDASGWATSDSPHAMLAALDPCPRKLRLLLLAVAGRLARGPDDEERWPAVRPLIEAQDEDGRGKRSPEFERAFPGAPAPGRFLVEEGGFRWWRDAACPQSLEHWAGREVAWLCTWQFDRGSQARVWDNLLYSIDVCLELAVRQATLPRLAEAPAANVAAFVRRVTRQARAEARRPVRQWLTALIRDVFPNPYHPLAVGPGWLDWNGGTVRRMAQEIHDGCRYADLPVLADALEEAGCAEEALLRHCRENGGHTRGCWALGLLLGKA